jgi:rubrerythrin
MYPFFFYPSGREMPQVDTGIQDYSKFLVDLEEAINEEAAAIRFYQKLMDLAPDAEQRDFIEHAHEEEIEHFRMFIALYRQLTGREAVVSVKDTVFSDYKSGIREAFEQELEAADLYQKMYLATRNIEIRDIFFKSMTDEMEHATRFSFIYHL